MPARFRLLSIAFLAASLLTGSRPAWAANRPVFAPCQIGAPDSPLHLQAQCTGLSVPENYAEPAAKHIRLHVAVLRARSGRPAPDPLFFLAGGPGQAATEAYVEESSAFERIREHRDIVLVDQRGTGHSHPLDCPPTAADWGTPAPAEIAAQARACLKRLPGDPRFYTTTVAVKDLDTVRTALGFARINLYGISYGTRVALEYLREFPTRVRSLILDGVVPPDQALGQNVSLDAERALLRIFARCEREAGCHRAFPDLAAAFADLQSRLARDPAKVSLRDPLTGAPLEETLSWEQAAAAVRLLSYTSESAALLPLLIRQAAVQQDYAPLLANALIFDRQLNNGIAQGMNTEVLCTEDVPFYPRNAAHERAMEGTYMGRLPVTSLLAVCRHWPRGVLAADFKQPVVSNRPALLISGEDDPITPPANAARVARTLENSLSLVLPGQGHGNAWRGCLPRLMAEFVREASVKGLDASCVEKIKPFPFFTRFTGPGP